jgi:hypothetical protein
MFEQSEFLSPERVQSFVTRLSGLSPREVQENKVLFVRNALSVYRAVAAGYQRIGCAGPFASAINYFWPVIVGQKKLIRARLRLADQRIHNVIQCWRADMRGQRFQLGDEEIVV